MSVPEKFTGYATYDPSESTWSEVKPYTYEPKPFEEFDVDIRIQTCSICGSDAHAARNGWKKPNAQFPLVTGHEIIGEVVRIGPHVKNFKIGDRVGVGAQSQSCLKCKMCLSNNETYCPKLVHTFGAFYNNEDGSKTFSQGGYANYVRIHEYFVFHIPEIFKNEEAAPFMCAGITTYSPLIRNLPYDLISRGIKPKVGIVGLGGLGMMAIQFSKALNCETYVFSRGNSKREDAIKLGADKFIATGSSENWVEENDIKFELDLVICTANSAENFGLNSYLKVLKINGKWVSVGLPETPFTVSPRTFMSNACFMGASHLGSHVEMIEMLKLAVEKGIRPWVECLEMSTENCKLGLEKCHNNQCKYRVAMVNIDKAFGTN
jgi:alcohol dehydrogenase (NADP+)